MAEPQAKEITKILIVENEVIIGEDLRARVESLGYAALDVVGSADEAIRRVEAERPDLVLMAINLKGEMDGFDAAEVVRARFETPVVFITAYGDKERLARAKPALPFGYVLKPFQDKDLRVTVEMAMHTARADSVRRSAERALKEANEQLSATLEALPDLMFEVDREGRIYKYRAPVEDMLYAPPDEFVERTIEEVLPADAAGIIRSAIDEASRTGRHCGAVYSLSMDKGTRWFELSISAKGDHNRPGRRFIILARDITERKETEESIREGEEKLRREEARYRLLAENSSDVIWTMDEEFNVTYCSPAVTGLLGYTPEELLVLPREKRFTPGSLASITRHYRNIAGLVREGRFSEIEGGLELEVLGKDGRLVWVEASIKPMLDRDGRFRGLMGSARDMTARVKAEQALRVSEERLSLVLKAANDGIWDWDIRTGEVYYSTRLKEIIGYEDHEIGNGPNEWESRVHPDDLYGVKKNHRDHMEGRTNRMEAQYRLRHKDGTYRWILSRGQCLWDANGKLNRMVGSHTDITAFRNTLKALEESENRFRVLLDRSADCIFVHDMSRRLVLVNRWACELLGYEHEELIGTSMDDLVANGREEEACKRRRRDIAAGQPVLFEAYFRKKDGSLVPVEIFLVKIELDGFPTVLVSARDVTARKKAEKNLKYSEERFRKVFEDAQLGMAISDPDFKLVKVNSYLCDMLGYSEAEMMEMSFPEITHPEDVDSDVQLADRLFRGELPYYYLEKRFLKKNGDILWVGMSASILRDTSGAPVWGLAMIRDISVRKRNESAAQVNQRRMEALVQLSRMDDFSNDEVAVFALEKSVDLTGSKFGTFVILSEDESRTTHIYFTDEARRHCLTQDDALEAPDSEWGLWAEALRHREPFIMDDYSKDHPAKKGIPDGHVELNRLLAIPIIHDGRVVAVAVVANKKEPYSELDVLQFRLFMEGLWRIMERRQVREKIVTSLREKEILLREVHHRVKNNLQVVSSLLNLQANKERDARVVGAIEESQSRISAMAMVHESVYQSESLASINLKTYLEGLIRNLEGAYSPNGRRIVFELSVRDNLELPMDRAAPCGLVMNELIANAVKHAFPGNRSGKIVMEGAPMDGGWIRLTVRDDGIGLPENLDLKNVESLGLTLVRSLVEFQLQGSVEIRRGGGTEFVISFPL